MNYEFEIEWVVSSRDGVVRETARRDGRQAGVITTLISCTLLRVEDHRWGARPPALVTTRKKALAAGKAWVMDGLL